MANKTILVTGSTGWLGGKLCEALVARGITVVGLARRDTEVAGVMSVRADLATGAGLEKLEGLEFDCCVHLAAVAGWGALGDCLEGQGRGVVPRVVPRGYYGQLRALWYYAGCTVGRGSPRS